MLSVSRRAVYHFRWRECIFGYGGYSQRRQWRRAHRICRGGHRIHNITQIPRAARSAVPAPADSSATTRSWSRCMEVALEYSHPGNDEAEFQLHVSGRRKPGVAVCRSRGAILRATATPREQRRRNQANIHSTWPLGRIPLDSTSYKLYYVNYKIGPGFASVRKLLIRGSKPSTGYLFPPSAYCLTADGINNFAIDSPQVPDGRYWVVFAASGVFDWWHGKRFRRLVLDASRRARLLGSRRCCLFRF